MYSDQMPHSAASDLSLHCLLRFVCPNVYGYYGTGTLFYFSEMNPLDYIYQSVGCSVQPLREDDVESQYILKYIKSSTKRKLLPCNFTITASVRRFKVAISEWWLLVHRLNA